ncbi:hypothetical protein QQ045_025163 [Rhodiola kirilowii]
MNILNLYGRSNQIVWVGDALVESGRLSGVDGGYKISCDCSWYGNSDTMGIGVVVSKQGKVIERISADWFIRSSCVSEGEGLALLSGMKCAQENGYKAQLMSIRLSV